MNKKTNFFTILLVLVCVCTSCIDEIDFETETFESALVIEATITDEFKNQEVLLSRTFKFEEDGPNPELNANVRIESDNGTFTFQEMEDGKYVSTETFATQANINYQLLVTTSDGRSYSSAQTQSTSTTQIDDVYAERETNDDGVNGISIYADSFDPSGNSRYYRYEYLETAKVIAPFWTPMDLNVTLPDFPDCEVEVVNRTQEEQLCFRTVSSININQVNTTTFTEDRVSRHLVRFISSDNFLLTQRYSILVSQYIQSAAAFTYFETLKEFSGENGSLFSQSQPGFFSGNVFSVSNSVEKVIGFFDVSTVSSERIFFNYDDFYPGEEAPPFIVSCDPVAPSRVELGSCGSLISEVLRNRVKYLDTNDGVNYEQLDGGPYLVVLRECGDCTALGDNVEPDFWQE